MDNLIEIKENDFIKYRKNIYLVKKFGKLDNGKYRLNYYFRSLNKKNAKLYTNGFSDNYDWQFKYIKEPSQEEIKLLISKIKKEYPDLNLPLQINDDIENQPVFVEDECVKYLKSKGYLVFKQV